jgi:hypothetical protein
MRVLVIEPCYVGYGGYFRAHYMCLALSRQGLKVDLLLSSKSNFCLRIKKHKINENFNQYELPRVRISSYINGRISRAFIGLFFGLFRRYDIIHACVPTQLEANIPGFILKLIGKKVVMDWDDYWLGSPLFGNPTIIRKYLEFCEYKAPKFFENMVVVSDFLADKSKELGAKRVVKIINGVNPDQFKIRTKEESFERLKLDKSKKYLLTFGNNFSRMRTLLLFKFFRLLLDIEPNTILLINTDPKKMISDHKLEKEIDKSILGKITNLGYIRDEDMEYYLAASDATILLQENEDNERSCFPIRAGSFISGETIIIMNDVNSEIGNTLKRYQCAIVEEEIEILARRTAELLNNPALQKEFKEKVIIVKEELAWDNQIPALIEFYKTIIS